MNILYVLRRSGDLQSHSDIIRGLCKRGHNVTCLFEREVESHKRHPKLDQLESQSGFQWDWQIPTRRSIVDRGITFVRKSLTYSTWLQETDQSRFYLDRCESELPSLMRRAVRTAPFRAVLRMPVTKRLLRRATHYFPADGRIKNFLREGKYDVVVVSPTNIAGTTEFRYVIAAQRMGIPSVVVVLSWDTLTTKEIIPVVPDFLLAWNEWQQRESVQIHQVPEEQIVISGAYRFDECFSADRHLLTRAEFCNALGFSDSDLFILYAGSSPTISNGEEHRVVSKLSECLSRDARPGIRGLKIVYRPHPMCHQTFPNLEQLPNVIVQRSDGEIWSHLQISDANLRGLYNVLHHSVALVGINTSAMWECLILNRPCYALLSDEFRKTQMESLHFDQVRRTGAVCCVEDMDELLSELNTLLEGYDSSLKARQRFVERYIRPCGLETDASEVAANAIVAVAKQTRVELGSASALTADAIEVES